ncbi:glycine--tRNA ligase [Patescibacteria group bacterium]|nr:glycine--tRNA ligase [Patescibacteria group bacterium]
MEDIISLAKRRGFVYPASEIYGGLSNAWDYGPLGTILKNNIKNEFIRFFTILRDDIVLLDSAIIQNPLVWKASGHIEHFTDPLTDCLSCKKRYRADQLIEDTLSTNVEGLSTEDMTKIIEENNIKCPECGGKLTKVSFFNLMFVTHIGPIEDVTNIAFLRPETAQGIFTNFLNITKSTRVNLPFGVLQIGKAFRNEITAGNFIFRTLEFEQMEIEYFVDPKDSDKAFEELFEYNSRWYDHIGIKKENIKYVELSDTERAHYSKKTIDIYFKFPFGFKELQSFANRSDYDLRKHSEYSSKDLVIFDEKSKKNIYPYVIEPSIGLDRLFLALLINGFCIEDVSGEERIVLKLSHRISPYQVAIFPLVGKGESLNLSRRIYDDLKLKFRCIYDMGGSIGKRYRRQDEIGTPKCITIDPKSLEDNMVTIRDRDTMKQDRVKIDKLSEYLNQCFI